MQKANKTSIGIDEEERKKRLEEIRKSRERAQEERRLIELQRISDQSYRRERVSAVSAAVQEQVERSRIQSASSVPPQAATTSTCIVQFLLPSGERCKEDFLSETKLAQVYRRAAALLNRDEIFEEFTLVCPPRQVVTDEMMEQSLSEAKMLPGVSFTVQLKSSQGMVKTSLSVSTDFEQAFVTEVRWMLREDGLLAWEAETWVSIIEGRLRRGEMHPLRQCLKSLFGGRPLPQVVSGWVQRVDKAPKPHGAAQVLKEPLERFLADVASLSDNDLDILGMKLERGAIEGTLRMTLSKLPPDSALARDLASLQPRDALIIIDAKLPTDFPFEAPWLRITQPPLSMAAASPEQPNRRPSILMETGQAAKGLEGGKAGAWSMQWASSAPRLMAWTRNWLVGSGARLDQDAIRLGRVQHSPCCAAAMWKDLKVCRQGVLPAGHVLKEGLVVRGVDLPASWQTLVTHCTKEASASRSQEEASASNSHEDSSTVSDQQQHDVHMGGTSNDAEADMRASTRSMPLIIEITCGQERVVCGVRCFDAPEGSVALPESLFDGAVDVRAIVRSVTLSPAASITCRPALDSHVNFLRHNVADIQRDLSKFHACCQADDKMLLKVNDRDVELIVTNVQGEASCCFLDADTRVALDA